METTGARPEDLDPAQQLRELERAEALPFVVYPATPWWAVTVLGFFFATAVLFFSSAYTDTHRVLTVVSVIAMAAAMGAFFAVVRQRYGAYPRPPFSPTAPREIRALYWRYLTGLVVVVALTALVWWWVGPFVAAGATFALATACLALYERTYARVAAVVRARLGIEAA